MADFGLPSNLHTLEEADKALQHFSDYFAQLKRRRNSLTPVGRLPDDVLVEIFCYLVAAHDLRDTVTSRGPDDYPHRWIYVTHVCHSWRSVAFFCSALWTRVVMTGSERVEAFLERSQGRPIGIESSIRKLRFEPEATRLLELSKRLQAIRDIHFTPHLSSALERMCPDGLHLPELVELHAVCDPASASVLANAHIPRLRVLSLVRTPCSVLRSLLRSTVTSLHIVGLCDFLLEDWVAVLGSMTQLESLVIQNVMRPLNFWLTESHTPPRRVALPHLRRITLVQSGPVQHSPSGYFLAHLDYPEDACTSCIIFSHYDTWSHQMQYIVAQIASKYSTHAREKFRFAKVQLERGAAFDDLKLSYAVHRGPAAGAQDAALYLEVALPPSAAAHAHAEFYRRLRGLSLPLGIQMLDVSGLTAPSATWPATMQDSGIFADVATLWVGTAEFLTLLQAMESASPNDATPPLLPKLRNLCLTHRKGKALGVVGSAEERARGRLLAVLHGRRRRGLGPTSVFLGARKEQTDDLLAGFTLEQ